MPDEHDETSTQESQFMTAEEASSYTRKLKLPDRPQGYSSEVIARAARKQMIPGAKKYGQAWMLPVAGVRAWIESEIAHKTGPKS